MTSFLSRSGVLAVILALIGNSFITLLKFFGFFISGSGVLFAEAVHSIADTMNQGLLLLGIVKSQKKADSEHIYGYGQERFLWALISACGIFFLGAGVTVYRGVASLYRPETIENHLIILGILVISFFIESITLLVAARSLKKAHPGENFKNILKHGDPTTIAVLYEDGMALLGVIIALVSLVLTKVTGHEYWDSFGSIAIGLGLAGIAVMLIQKNRSFLLNKSVPHTMKKDIIELLHSEPVIEKVVDFKSTVLDIGVYHIKCEIEFNGAFLMKDLQDDLHSEFEEIDGDYEAFKKFVVRFIDRTPRLIGEHINRIEQKIKDQFPEIKHIDIELN